MAPCSVKNEMQQKCKSKPTLYSNSSTHAWSTAKQQRHRVKQCTKNMYLHCLSQWNQLWNLFLEKHYQALHAWWFFSRNNVPSWFLHDSVLWRSTDAKDCLGKVWKTPLCHGQADVGFRLQCCEDRKLGQEPKTRNDPEGTPNDQFGPHNKPSLDVSCWKLRTFGKSIGVSAAPQQCVGWRQRRCCWTFSVFWGRTEAWRVYCVRNVVLLACSPHFF